MNAKLLMIVDASNKENFDRLTIHRMPGALPFAGKYRLIDFPLSLAKHAGITNVAIFPYGNYRSLQDHVGSGKRWDLDRRRDGLFILPPKHFHLPTDNMLTFQRMHEHIEFFKRSAQDYVFMTQANIVWNIDIVEYLQKHLQSGADISEIMHENLRLKTFVFSRKRLLHLLESYDQLPYQTMNDYVVKAPNVTVNRLNYPGYTRYITDNFNYLKSNLTMLDFQVGKDIFAPERPILSKEKPAPPAKYLMEANIKNAMISSGSIINGTVIDSVVGRDVIIEKGARVRKSVIMSNAIIEPGADISYAIIDKGTLVKANAHLEGTLREPYVSQKEQIITQQTTLSVLFVAAESSPFIKTGGLGDVVNDLSRNLVKKGVKVSVAMPYYGPLKEKIAEVAKRLSSHVVEFDGEPYKVNLYTVAYKGVNYYFFENFKYFDPDLIYDAQLDCDRFAFFNKAVVELYPQLGQFNLFHLHDWHVSLVPLLLKQQGDKTPTLLTLHNVEYQGVCHGGVCQSLVDPALAHERTINFLETGISHATKISTVSPTYRDELKYEYYGKNLTSTLINRERDFHGVLNGISSTHNPATDKLIKQNYDAKSFAKKAINKAFLQKDNRLPNDPSAFVIGMVSRLAEQKGFEIIFQMLERFMHEHEKAQFVLLGSGDEHIAERLKQMAKKFPNRMRLNIGFDATIPNYIYAGADVFLMPSRVEPCGLSQMIAMRYGTVPVVRQTGGLNDTVVNFDSITLKGNGFSFFNFDGYHLYQSLHEAYDLYTTQPEVFRKVALKGMSEDFGLLKQANKMIELYQLTIQGVHENGYSPQDTPF